MTAVNTATLPSLTTDSGADAITVSGTGATGAISLGGGNDTLTLAATTASMTYTLDGGAGALDTLTLADGSSYAAGTISLAGFERINIAQAGNNGSAVTVQNANITGQSFIMTSDEATGNAVTITVSMAAAEAIADLSSLVFDATLVAANDIMVINNNVATNLTLSGSDIIDQFTGGSGNDTMTGGAGADVLNAAAGNNTIDGGAGGDTITTTTGTDTITGGDGADTINSGAAADTITAGEGADIVLAGAGGDTVTLTETTSAADNVGILALTDGSAAVAAAGTFSGFDVITGFATTVDDIVFDSNTNGDDTVDTDIVSGSVIVAAGTAAVTASNDLTTANYTSVDAVVNYYNDAVNTSAIAAAGNNNDILAVTLGSGTGVMTALYHIVDDANGIVDASEIVLIATADATLVAGDIIA
jgi:Ca2+-binding RTX toxin-like protein